MKDLREITVRGGAEGEVQKTLRQKNQIWMTLWRTILILYRRSNRMISAFLQNRRVIFQVKGQRRIIEIFPMRGVFVSVFFYFIRSFGYCEIKQSVMTDHTESKVRGGKKYGVKNTTL